MIQIERAAVRMILALCSTLLVTASSQAADGIVLINQAVAEAGGVTAGDTAGFPVSLSTGGSYRLVGNLTVADQNTTAIVYSASSGGVIDLNGFVISCPTCSVAGTGDGIRKSSGADLIVKNGSVRNMGATGLDLDSAHATVDQVTVIGNKLEGMILGDNCIVMRSRAEGNGANGIRTRGESCLIKDNVSHGNTGDGISGGDMLVTGNVVKDNGGDGIFCFRYCSVQGNWSKDNVGFGLRQWGPYGDNFFENNNGGNANPQVLSSGTLLESATNWCGGDLTCP